MRSIVRNRHRGWISISALFCVVSGGSVAAAGTATAARKEFLEAARLTPNNEHGKQLYKSARHVMARPVVARPMEAFRRSPGNTVQYC